MLFVRLYSCINYLFNVLKLRFKCTRRSLFFLSSSDHKKKQRYKKDKESFIPTENIFLFWYRPREKTYQKTFTTCLLQAQKAEMVSRENKTESLFLLTIALSYKTSLNPQPPVTVEFPLFLRSALKGNAQALVLGLIGCRLMLSNNIPVL